MTDIAAGAGAPDDPFATTSKASSTFAWSAQAKPLSAGLLKGGLYLYVVCHVVNMLVLVVLLWAFQIWSQEGGIEDQTVAMR
jgi:hypothetical protein